MAINHPEVQIANAIPPLDAVSTRKGTTFQASVYDASYARRSAYLKLLKLEDIAREVLCAVLARMLGLPIQQAFYVHVEPAIVPGHRTGNRYNLAFGLEREHHMTFRIANDQINDAIRRWPEALVCGVFDEWIFNGDRLPKNLLFARNGVYWMIDHDEALPNSAQPIDVCHSQILHLLSEEKTELELHRIKRDALIVVQQLKGINWDDVRKFVFTGDVATTGIDSHFEKYISFLRQRIDHMPEILTQSLGIKQLNMKLENYIASEDREEKKS